MKTLRYILITVTAMAAVSCALFSGKEKKNDVGLTFETPEDDTPANVEVIVATTREVPQENVYASSVQPYAINNIAPQSGGRIQKICTEVGSYVYRGQILAEMDKLQLEQTRLQVKNDSTEYSRIKSLYEKGGVAKSDLDAIELAYNVRKETLKNLEENTILRSPITGYVTARNYDRGDMYTMAQPLFTVQQVVPVKLLVGISESEYTMVKKGDKVTLTVDAIPGRTFSGSVSRLYPTIDAATHTFNAEVIVQNSDKALRPGMYARVTVTFGKRNSVIVPDKCIVKQEGSGQRFVYIVNGDDNTVSFAPVTLGRHIGDEYEVREGIPDGATVVFKGQVNLRDGKKVNVL